MIVDHVAPCFVPWFPCVVVLSLETRPAVSPACETTACCVCFGVDDCGCRVINVGDIEAELCIISVSVWSFTSSSFQGPELIFNPTAKASCLHQFGVTQWTVQNNLTARCLQRVLYIKKMYNKTHIKTALMLKVIKCNLIFTLSKYHKLITLCGTSSFYFCFLSFAFNETNK